jgi:ELWxxDGT repeat protein
LFFLADNTRGMELWKSNGTKAGTVLVKRVEPGGASHDYDYGPTDLTALAGKLLFSDDDDMSGWELWRSNGTRSGTVMVKDIYPGRRDGEYDYYRPYSSYPAFLTAVRGKVFFSATDSAHGSELWKSNGTKAGTVLVKDIRTGDDASAPSNLTGVAGTLFFSAKEGVHGRELWASDGTKAGTVLVKDIRTGEDNSSPSSLTAVGGALFFTANDGVHGPGLWKSSGSRTGTVMVKDIRPCSDEGGWPSPLSRVGSTLYFAADDGVHGQEPWAVDPDGGAALLADVEPGAGAGVSDWPGYPVVGQRPAAAAAGTAFFLAGAAATGEELWASDGTPDGTRLVRDVFPGPRSAEIRWLTAAGGRVYFTADDGVHGRELWVSDGTPAGTVLVADLVPGPGSSLPDQLFAAEGRLYFSAHTAAFGREPWVSDGTAAGTVRLDDIAPGPLPSSPLSFTRAGDWLYFAATDAVTGFELWRLPLVDGAEETKRGQPAARTAEAAPELLP